MPSRSSTPRSTRSSRSITRPRARVQPRRRGDVRLPRQDVLGEELAELIVPPEYRDAHRKALARWTADGPTGGSGHAARPPHRRRSDALGRHRVPGGARHQPRGDRRAARVHRLHPRTRAIAATRRPASRPRSSAIARSSSSCRSCRTSTGRTIPSRSRSTSARRSRRSLGHMRGGVALRCPASTNARSTPTTASGCLRRSGSRTSAGSAAASSTE